MSGANRTCLSEGIDWTIFGVLATATFTGGLMVIGGFDAQFTANDFNVEYSYLGGGYGVVSDLERDAIRLLGSREGILLDPVYTGRAIGALIDLVRKKAFRPDETVLFWHTGGAPALFAYQSALGI